MKTNEEFYSWRKKAIVRYELTLHRKYDEDIINMLDLQENKRDYIKKLVRKDLAEKTKIIEERRAQKEKEKH